MKKIITLIFAACYLLMTSSCRAVYTPNMQNVPIFKEKNELRATLGFNNYQVAYAVTDHIGIMVNGQRKKNVINSSNSFSVNSVTNGSDFQDVNKKRHFEGGAGYFTAIEEWGVFEIYGGGGVGSVSFDRSDSQSGVSFDKYSAKASRLFIQPSIGMTNEYLDLALSLRFVQLKFYKADLSAYTNSSLFEEDLRYLDQSNYSFVEPAFTFRVGGEKIKFHLQGILSIQVNSTEFL